MRFVTDIYNSRTECGGRLMLHELLKYTVFVDTFLRGIVRGHTAALALRV